MPAFNDVLNLYGSPPEQIVDEVSSFSRTAFTETDAAVPVLICAYNEEDDLPVTLAALSRSDIPVHPYVIDNGSTDRTREFAETMGATVLHEARPAKVHAVISGLGHISVEQAKRDVLFTDADTVMSKRWGSTMLRYLALTGEFAAVSGISIFHRRGEARPSYVNTALRSTTALLDYYYRAARVESARGRGNNMAIRFDSSNMARELIDDMDTSYLLSRDDRQLFNLAKAQGAATKRVLDPRAIAITRGDRMPDLRSSIKAYFDRYYHEVVLYKDWFDRAESEASSAE